MSNWLDFDLDKTVKDFEYTRRAAIQMNRVIDSDEFKDMDSDMIFDYLANRMEIVWFPDYLKRYIYEKLKMDVPFKEVSNEDYLEIISASFTDNCAPCSLTPTTTKKTAMIKLWLSQPGTKRNTIFTLGFGLRMRAEEVSEFLTKVLKEEDFDFDDPTETIFWHCYKHDLPYALADHLIKEYETMAPGDAASKKWMAMRDAPEIYLLSERNLRTYLSILKARGTREEKETVSFDEFKKLYDRCCEIISEQFNQDEAFDEGKRNWTPAMIRPSDLEKVLCSGMPSDGTFNLKALSASRLGKLFQKKRMSRQRISGILNHTYSVERFDLITLLFFIYACTVEPDWPAERYLRYIDDVNGLLTRCHMEEIYPANPYEAFILMCIVSEYPLNTYAEVWAKSFD